jgi:hypothetical protein
MKKPGKTPIKALSPFFAAVVQVLTLVAPFPIETAQAQSPVTEEEACAIGVYDREGFQVANSLYRFAVSNWMPFTYNSDGSLDLYFQNESPGS